MNDDHDIYKPEVVDVGRHYKQLGSALATYLGRGAKEVNSERIHKALLAGFFVPKKVVACVREALPHLEFPVGERRSKKAQSVRELEQTLSLPRWIEARRTTRLASSNSKNKKPSDREPTPPPDREPTPPEERESTPPVEEEPAPPAETEVTRPITQGRMSTDPSGSRSEPELGRKRRFNFLTSPDSTTEEAYNRRNADGELLPLEAANRVVSSEFDRYDRTTDEEVPDELHTIEVYTLWNTLREVNGRPFYNAEVNALGSLRREEYLFLPANRDIPICDVANVGKGLDFFPLGGVVMAAIYALAKAQAVSLGFTGEKTIKWACLRLESVKAGWYAGQKYVVRKEAPRDCYQTMAGDFREIAQHLPNAWKLAGFVPLVAEYFFRQNGGSYSQTNAEEFVNLTQRLARASGFGDILTYTDDETLYGLAFRWIGVRRPMQVIKAATSTVFIPNVFHIRKSAAPAGQAIIGTSAAVIQAMKQCNWWAGVAAAGGYESARIEEVARLIVQDPWKYHIMSGVYGLAPLTAEEQEQINNAKQDAVNYSPVLQAFIENLLPTDPLTRARVLQKPASSNAALRGRATRFFRALGRQRINDVTTLFRTDVIAPTRGQIEPPDGE